MDLYIKIFEVIFPVFFVIGIGYYLGKKNPNIDTNFITNFAGNIEVGVYQRHLDELQIEITQGDYLGYYENETKVRYYSVWDDGRITSDLKHSYGGYKAFYRTIKAVAITENEFRGL